MRVPQLPAVGAVGKGRSAGDSSFYVAMAHAQDRRGESLLQGAGQVMEWEREGYDVSDFKKKWFR